MSKDYRLQFMQDVETALVVQYGADQSAIIADVVAKVLNNYEITERCTDLVPQDDRNEKLLKRYSACLMVDGKSKKTIYQYIWVLRKLSELIQKPFAEMGAYDIRFYFAMEKERGISNRTLENHRSYISAFFQWMSNEEIIVKNPITKVKRIKCPVEIKKPFSEVEIDAIRGACTNLKERALIEVLLSTGVRVYELTEMEIKDINQSTLAVHVIHGKGAKERMTYTTAVALKHLLAYLNTRHGDCQALFCNYKGEPIGVTGIQYILLEIGKRAGVENVHPHRFRRTLATFLAKRGMPIQEIQKLLGHSNISTTMRYVCVEDEKVQASHRRYIA